MSKYTAEQVEAEIANYAEEAFPREEIDLERVTEMLRDYADLLRERESAKAPVTYERLHELVHGVIAPNHSQLTEDGDGYYFSCDALEAFTWDVIKVVAPHLASARVPERTSDMTKFVDGLGWVVRLSDVPEYTKRLIEQTRDLLAAAPKPETE